MSAYVLGVIGTVLLCAIFTAILPEGKTNTVIKGVTRLACVVSIVMPVLIFFQSGEWSMDAIVFSNDFTKSAIDEDGEFIQYYSEMRVREAEAALKKEIYEKFSVECDVEIVWQMQTGAYAEQYEDRKIEITNIFIKNKEKQSEDTKKAMWEYLTKNYCSEVLIE